MGWLWSDSGVDLKIISIKILPAILLVFLAGCSCHVPLPTGTSPLQMQGWVTTYRRPLELHLSKPKDPSGKDILIVYATGDGGWRGLDKKIFGWISTWGYPVVGFSSRNYLKNLEYIRDTTTPRRLVRDFEQVIWAAEQKFEMQPSTPVVLVGLSRGAGLAVVAAGQGGLDSNLAGVIAIALTKEEEHVIYRPRRRRQPNQPRREIVKIQTYQYLPRINTVPVVVIQSTHDGYLPAGAARALFGPDTEMKKLIAIDARNHSFRGGCPNLYVETQNALSSISNFHKPSLSSR